MQLQFAASSYRSRSVPLDGQRCVNMFTERAPAEAKTPVPVFMCPGLSIFSQLGPGPINLFHVMNDTLYVVSGSQLYSVNQSGAATSLGNTNLGGGPIVAADNGQQLVMVDGNVGWIYQPGGLNQVTTITAAAGAASITVAATGALAAGDPIMIALDSGGSFQTTIASAPTGSPGAMVIPLATALPSQVTAGAICIDSNVTLGQIRQPGFLAAQTVIYFDSYFVFDGRGTNSFFISNEGDGTQYNALSIAFAQADPDLVIAVVNWHEQLLIMGEKTIEVWYDSGGSTTVPFPFQRFDGAFVQRGCASALSIVKEDNTVLWLGEDGVFYRLDGYLPVRCSTFATEEAWQQYPTINDAQAFVVTVEGHKFLFLTFVAGNATWCYDITSGVEQPLWHERESWGQQQVPAAA